jgi:hypothetical protein
MSLATSVFAPPPSLDPRAVLRQHDRSLGPGISRPVPAPSCWKSYRPHHPRSSISRKGSLRGLGSGPSPAHFLSFPVARDVARYVRLRPPRRPWTLVPFPDNSIVPRDPASPGRCLHPRAGRAIAHITQDRPISRKGSLRGLGSGPSPAHFLSFPAASRRSPAMSLAASVSPPRRPWTLVPFSDNSIVPRDPASPGRCLHPRAGRAIATSPKIAQSPGKGAFVGLGPGRHLLTS